MNKQALAFLTMFSMILMLSVYYVTLPSDNVKSVMKDENTKQDSKTVSKREDTSKKADKKKATVTSDEAQKLQTVINQKKDSEINKHSEVIANEGANEDAKKQALAKLDVVKQQKTLQQTIVDALLKEGYKTAIEINDTTCMVNVFEQKNDKTIAKQILLKTSELTNNNYLMEVAFK